MDYDPIDLSALRYETESDSIDFKSQQYRFSNADDNEKSELLKDILSFANAWRRSTAHILIGFKAASGKRAEVKGINESLDDAWLQQFVNSKTNRPVHFRYRELTEENRLVALISIPVQQRPVYLKKDYGGLHKDVVYVRRGSSTVVADPTEIAEMGQEKWIPADVPIELAFYDRANECEIGVEYNISLIHLHIPELESIPEYGRDLLPRSFIHLGLEDRNNSEYYREVAKWLQATRMTGRIALYLRNDSAETVYGLRGLCNVPYQQYSLVKDGSCGKELLEFPKKMYRRFDEFLSPILGPFTRPHSKLYVDDVLDKNRWEIGFRADTLLPGELLQFDDCIFLQPRKPGRFDLSFKILAENLPSPKRVTLMLNMKIESQKMTVADIIQFAAKKHG